VRTLRTIGDALSKHFGIVASLVIIGAFGIAPFVSRQGTFALEPLIRQETWACRELADGRAAAPGAFARGPLAQTSDYFGEVAAGLGFRHLRLTTAGGSCSIVYWNDDDVVAACTAGLVDSYWHRTRDGIAVPGLVDACSLADGRDGWARTDPGGP